MIEPVFVPLRAVCIGCLSRVCVHFDSAPAVPARLAPRELELLKLLSGGLSNKEIAIQMHLGVGTVKQYLHIACGKLGLASRLEAALWALAHPEFFAAE